MKMIVKYDKNGNSVAKLSQDGKRGISIQTNGNLLLIHREAIRGKVYFIREGSEYYSEMLNYVSKHGTPGQKEFFGVQVFEYPLIWNNEEIDVAVSKKDAFYLQREYEMAYSGPVSFGRKRRV